MTSSIAPKADVVWLTAPGEIAFRSEPLPVPQPGQLRCETIVTAISPGTELAAFTGQPPLRPGNPYPRLQGYCNVARVAASHAAGFAAGDCVLTFQSHRSGFVIDAADVLVKLPADADPGHVACAYLYHLGYNAVLRAGVRPGHRVVVIGLGVLGLTSVAMAVAAGADVYAISDQHAPAVIALALGARGVISRDQAATLPAADVVITTVNGWSDWQLALRCAGPNATIAVLGFPGRGAGAPTANPLDSAQFYMKQLRIEAVGMSPEANDGRGFLRFNERDNLGWIVERIVHGTLDPSLLISGRFPAPSIGDAYAALIARTGSPVTFLLDWSRP